MERGGGFAEGFCGAEVVGREDPLRPLRGHLPRQDGGGEFGLGVGRHRRDACATGGGGKSGGGLVGEVGGLLEGGEGLEVEVGVDRGGAGLVDGLDRFGGDAEVFGVGEVAELWEGEAVDLADDDGGHRGVEEVFEELFCEGLGTGHWGLGGRGRRVGGGGGRSGGGMGALTPALSHQNGRGRKRKTPSVTA